jgi:hypothetical protein
MRRTSCRCCRLLSRAKERVRAQTSAALQLSLVCAQVCCRCHSRASTRRYDRIWHLLICQLLN